MLYLTVFAPTCSGFSLQWIPGQTPAEGPQSSPWQQLWEDPEQLRPYGVPPAERRAQHWVQEHGKIIFWYFTLQWVQKILPLYFTQHEDQKHAKILPIYFIQHWVQKRGKILPIYFIQHWVQRHGKILPIHFTQHWVQRHSKISLLFFWNKLKVTDALKKEIGNKFNLGNIIYPCIIIILNI